MFEVDKGGILSVRLAGVKVVRESLLDLVEPQRAPRSVRANVHLADAGFAAPSRLEQLRGGRILEVVVVPSLGPGVEPPTRLVARRDGDVVVPRDLPRRHERKDVPQHGVDVRPALAVGRVPDHHLGVLTERRVNPPSAAVLALERDVDVRQEGFLVALGVVVRNLRLARYRIGVVRDDEHAPRAASTVRIRSGTFRGRVRSPVVVAEEKNLVRREPPPFAPPSPQRAPPAGYEPEQLAGLVVAGLLPAVRVRAGFHHPPLTLLRQVAPLLGAVQLKLLNLIPHGQPRRLCDGVPLLAVPLRVPELEEAHEYVREQRR